jgi:carbon storage regulator
MLVLTRRVGEEIRIAEDIYIRVVELEPNRVYLGITAPQEIRVDRKEVYLRRLEQMREQETSEAHVPIS